MPLNWSSLKATAFRLRPGCDLKLELLQLIKDNRLQAAAVIAAVGSLSTVSLRLANRPGNTQWDSKHEIVSLSGTLSQDGAHLHLSVADSDGHVLGGHLMEGSLIFTTAEIVIAELSDLVFIREPCQLSGFNELLVDSRDKASQG